MFGCGPSVHTVRYHVGLKRVNWFFGGDERARGRGLFPAPIAPPNDALLRKGKNADCYYKILLLYPDVKRHFCNSANKIVDWYKCRYILDNSYFAPNRTNIFVGKPSVWVGFLGYALNLLDAVSMRVYGWFGWECGVFATRCCRYGTPVSLVYGSGGRDITGVTHCYHYRYTIYATESARWHGQCSIGGQTQPQPGGVRWEDRT